MKKYIKFLKSPQYFKCAHIYVCAHLKYCGNFRNFIFEKLLFLMMVKRVKF